MVAPATVQGVLQTGTHAARPAASVVGAGTLYSCTTHGLVYQSDGATWTTWATLGGGSGRPFKRTVLIGTGNKTTTSTTKAPIDSTNLAYLTLALAIGDVVRCLLTGQGYTGTTGVAGFDFEVDQPTSANTYIANGADYGLGMISGSATRQLVAIEGLFTATEAGSHGFRPVWNVNAGTETLANATSGVDDTAITFIVENLGPVTP